LPKALPLTYNNQTTFLTLKTNYMEVRFQINDEFIENLKKEAGVRSTAQITDDALTFYQWAVSEMKKGRILLSADENGNNGRQIVFPGLEKLKAGK
jgi:hypothetical protein